MAQCCSCRGRHLQPGQLAVFASFFLFFLSLGNISSFAILYVYLQDNFKASAVETGWVGSTAWVVMNFLAPLPSALYVKFGCQKVVLAGILLSFTGLLATSFANHLWVMCITYGLMFGAGSNFILTATINLVTTYYPGENNIRATSLASAGQPVGLFVVSASLERACFYLGWRNGLRIVAGFTLVVGMLCTALSRSPRHTTFNDCQDVDCKLSAENNNDPEEGGSATLPAHAPRVPDEPGRETAIGVRGGIRRKEAYEPLPSQDADGAIVTDSAWPLQKSTSHRLANSSTELDRTESSSHFRAKFEMELYHTTSLGNLKANSSKDDRQQLHADAKRTVDSAIGESSFLDTLHQERCLTDSDLGGDLPNQEPLVDRDSATISPNPTKLTFCARYLRLLRLPGHWLFFSGIIGSAWAGLFNVIQFVSYASTVNISERTASTLLIVMSGMEIAARVLVFVCGNRVPVNRTIVFAVVCVMGALATYGILVAPSFAMVTIYMITLGFVRGTLYAIGYCATVDTFGVDCALEAYTSLLLSYGIAGAMASTVGISKDLTGSFTVSLHIIAVLFLLSAIFFGSARAWRKRNPLIRQRQRATHHVDANRQDDVNVVDQQGNGVVAIGEALTTL